MTGDRGSKLVGLVLSAHEEGASCPTGRGRVKEHIAVYVTASTRVQAAGPLEATWRPGGPAGKTPTSA